MIIMALLFGAKLFLLADTMSIDMQIQKIKNAPEKERFMLVNELKRQIAQMHALEQARAVSKYQQETLSIQQNANIANTIQRENQTAHQQQIEVVVPVENLPTTLKPPVKESPKNLPVPQAPIHHDSPVPAQPIAVPKVQSVPSQAIVPEAVVQPSYHDTPVQPEVKASPVPATPTPVPHHDNVVEPSVPTPVTPKVKAAPSKSIPSMGRF